MEGDGMQGKYIPQQIEKKWQQIWEETKAFETHLIRIKRNTMFLRCSRILRAIFIWGM